jgi:CRISPR-associated protein Csx14
MATEQTTLVATLGGQPQIVTFTLDELLRRGERITQVVVVYLANNPRYVQAYQLLAAEFIGDRYAGAPLHLRGQPIRLEGEELFTPQQVDAVHSTFQELLKQLKEQGQRVHLSLSGGRRLLALVALEAAMCYLRPSDRVWHIYTPPELTEAARGGKVMHASPGSVRLIETPFASLSAYAPGLSGLLKTTPTAQFGQAHRTLSEEDMQRCQTVWNGLGERQRQVLKGLANGQNRSELASQLNIAPSTVDTHRRTILDRCERTWEEESGIDTTFLRKKFGPYLDGLDSV